MEINEYKQCIESFTFESIIDRTKKRKGKTQEYFTPTELVQEMLDKMELSKPDLFTDENKTLIDNAAGDGKFLTQIVIRKMERSGCSLEKALSTTYGVELMEDNVKLNISFLLNELTDEELTQVVELIEGIRIRKIVRSMRT